MNTLKLILFIIASILVFFIGPILLPFLIIFLIVYVTFVGDGK